MSRLRILLVDDHTLVRRGLRVLLESYAEIEVVGEASDGLEAVEKAKLLKPDLILMDCYLPRLDGVEATRRILSLLPQTKVIMLSVADDDDLLLEALRAGAQGYLLKNLEPEQLIQLLRGASRGEAPISPELAKKILSSYAQRELPKVQPAPEELTAREREVLALVARGATNREIARTLFISQNTVKNHIRNIMDKLRCKNRAQAVAYAIEHGVIAPPENS